MKQIIVLIYFTPYIHWGLYSCFTHMYKNTRTSTFTFMFKGLCLKANCLEKNEVWKFFFSEGVRLKTSFYVCLIWPKPSNPKVGLIGQPQWELASFLFYTLTVALSRHLLKLPPYLAFTYHSREGEGSCIVWKSARPYYYFFMITSWWLRLMALYRGFTHTGRFVITRRSWSYH